MATMGEWVRREQLLVLFLAVSAAVCSLGAILKAPWLASVGLVVALWGAVARLLVGVRKARLERASEAVELDRRLRVQVAPIAKVDPRELGVDPAAQNVLPGREVPRYVDRAIDAPLREAIRDGLDGHGPWLIVVEGASKYGKSRSLYEALTAPPWGEALLVVAPVDTDALRSILDPKVALQLPTGDAVLWLDDLEPFLNQGLTFQILKEWQGAGRGRLVACTYGGKGSDLVAGALAAGIATIGSSLLLHARKLPLEALTEADLSSADGHASAADLALIMRHGLAAFLVAAPQLESKIASGRHAPGERACPAGMALVLAAVDWARCGRTDPISERELRRLW